MEWNVQQENDFEKSTFTVKSFQLHIKSNPSCILRETFFLNGVAFSAMILVIIRNYIIMKGSKSQF